MNQIRPRRSVLYIPGSNARAIEKAKVLGADALIFDLEDAVAPEMKALARDQVCSAVKSRTFGKKELIIRINAEDTVWSADDLEAALCAAPDAILLPKVASADTLLRVDDRLQKSGSADHIRLWAMIETPKAILNIQSIAAAARGGLGRLECFVIGTNDLAKESRARITAGRAAMIPWLMTALAGARSEGIDIVDGVFNAIGDIDGFHDECAQGRDCGFDGKTLIHPEQIDVANAVFAPTEQEIADARAIVEAFQLPENTGKGAINLNGRMVEKLHAEIALRLLDLAAAIAEK